MKTFLLSTIFAGGIMGALDFVWLTMIAKKLYTEELGSLLLAKPNMGAVLVFYAVYLIGVAAFVIVPALDKGSWLHALSFGALFGLVAYATYDLTNLATLKGFSTKVVAVDLLWGSFLTSVVCLSTYGLVQLVTK